MPKRNHRGIHGYRFADALVGILSDCWSKVDSEQILREASFLIYYLKFIVPNSIDFLRVRGELKQADDLSDYLEEILQFLPRIEEPTCQYTVLFKDAVEAVGDDGVEALKSDYLTKLASIIEAMDKYSGISEVLKSYRLFALSRQTPR